MLFKFVFFSDESEEFLREITIDADTTFLDLNKAILKACGYEDGLMTSFFICDDGWEQKDQITREDMDIDPGDKDIYVMEKVTLRDFISDEDQKLVFVFDPFNDRIFYVKVTEIIPGKNLKKPVVSRKEGKAPQQLVVIDDSDITKGTAIVDDSEDGDEYFGSDSFNDDELDLEGFEIQEY